MYTDMDVDCMVGLIAGHEPQGYVRLSYSDMI
jgi:hypothetical protein